MYRVFASSLNWTIINIKMTATFYDMATFEISLPITTNMMIACVDTFPSDPLPNLLSKISEGFSELKECLGVTMNEGTAEIRQRKFHKVNDEVINASLHDCFSSWSNIIMLLLLLLCMIIFNRDILFH